MNLLSAIFRAVAELFGFANRRTDLKNAPDVRKAAVNQSEADAVAKETKAVTAQDVDAIRKGLAD